MRKFTEQEVKLIKLIGRYRGITIKDVAKKLKKSRGAISTTIYRINMKRRKAVIKGESFGCRGKIVWLA